MTQTVYEDVMRKSRQTFNSVLGTNDPNLSLFKKSGGKMITWHGLSDPLIFPNGTSQYYDRVLAQDASAKDYYRFFQAPGIETEALSVEF
ncbi:hypothetical protein G7Y89_g12753 [Cudoniella acicularis]|uniref:Carboxylic ester hydrolase n=1 Tax=Cudoniella acicularis TaxID=354080 RepID=A0A8H4VWN9_9HELO|nr:hypothetical protein G7Y89_g12753 [Cudoniella acicularis]